MTRRPRTQTSQVFKTCEVCEEAITNGSHEPAKPGRDLYRYNFGFGKNWQGKHYPIKEGITASITAPLAVREKLARKYSV